MIPEFLPTERVQRGVEHRHCIVPPPPKASFRSSPHDFLFQSQAERQEITVQRTILQTIGTAGREFDDEPLEEKSRPNDGFCLSRYGINVEDSATKLTAFRSSATVDLNDNGIVPDFVSVITGDLFSKFTDCDDGYLTRADIASLACASKTINASVCLRTKQLYFSSDDDLWITDEAFVRLLKKCPNIQRFHFEYCTDIMVVAVAKYAKNLKQLDLDSCPNRLDPLAKSLPFLETLVLNCCGYIVTDDLLQSIVVNSPMLSKLGLWGCHNVVDTTLQAIASHCPYLQELDVSQCNITDMGLQAVAQQCLNLTLLELEGYGRNITDASIETVAANCSRLRVLNLSCLHNITGASVEALAAGCPELSTLKLSHCENITNVDLPATSNTHLLSKLKILNLFHCRNLTAASLQAILHQCCHCLTSLNLFGLHSLQPNDKSPCYCLS